MPKKITEDGEVLDTVSDEIIARAPPYWKTPWNFDTNAESDRTGLACKDPSRTKKEFAADADINNILRKFLNTGELPPMGQPVYQDFEEEFDLQTKMVTAYEVEQAWNALPVAVRNMLKDPKTFADYVTHCLETGDIDPLRDLGLAKPKAEPEAIGGGTPAPLQPKEPPAPTTPATQAPTNT